MDLALDNLNGQKILVVEDEYIIALDLALTIERLGMNVLGPVGTLNAALRLLARHDNILGAVLDVKVRGSTVHPVAAALRRRGVPFVFSSGHERNAIEPEFRDVPFFEKPVPATRVVWAVLGEVGSGTKCLEKAPTGADGEQEAP